MDENDIERALSAVGELLEADGERISIVVIGGAALLLLGIVARVTRDVDVVALTERPGDTSSLTRPPNPLPAPLRNAIARVARDFGLPENWMNRGPANQWDVGLPPEFAERIHWKRHAGLDVGLADRIDLIFFKLEAAADQPTSDSRHCRDLVALEPSERELALAAEWVRAKNAGEEYHNIVTRVIDYVTGASKNVSG